MGGWYKNGEAIRDMELFFLRREFWVARQIAEAKESGVKIKNWKEGLKKEKKKK